MKKIIWVIVVLVVLIIIGISMSRSNQSTGDSLKIGVSLPLTGPVAAMGQNSLDAMNIAVKEINDAGGINGKPIELIVEDDKCNAAEGTKTVNKLLSADKVPALIVYCGAVSGAVSDLINGKALAYSVSVRTEVMEEKYPFLFNLSPAPSKEVSVLSDLIVQTGVKKMAIFRQADFFGQTYENKIKQTLSEKGIEVVLQNATENLSTPDFRTDLAKAKNLGVQAIFTSFNPAQYAVLLKQANEQGLKVPFYSVFNTEGPLLTQQAGNLANGLIYTYSFSEGTDQAYEKFKKEYTKQYNKIPDFGAANGYDVIKLYAKVAQECGNNVSCLISKTSEIKNYNGVSGSFSFKDNMADKNVILKTVRDGKFVAY